MATAKRTLDQVPSLPYYGKHFPFIPWSTVSKLRVSWVFARHLLHYEGPLRFAAFWLLLPFRILPAHRQYREGLRLMRRQFGLIAEAEWFLLLLLYRDMERRWGRERAYRFAKDALQECSRFMMNDFYQAAQLSEFDDPFEAFWLYHKAMFADDPNYPNQMIEEPNLRVMVVSSCRNCEIARLTIPELAKLGCDHDITGYAAIQDKVQMEFRRPETLAKDGQPCRFMFFRKGTVPTGDIAIH